jgi:hypothetical protein
MEMIVVSLPSEESVISSDDNEVQISLYGGEDDSQLLSRVRVVILGGRLVVNQIDYPKQD